MSSNEELYCTHCGTKYDESGNYTDEGTGHWEYVDTREAVEIWYICFICRDAGEPCESFFPTDVDRNKNNLFYYKVR
jgi:hypothetical protein